MPSSLLVVITSAVTQPIGDADEMEAKMFNCICAFCNDSEI